MKMNKKGFTLIEMLVVIAIIAVLVAIVIPVVGNSTGKAEAATNAANLRSAKASLTIGVLNQGAPADDVVIDSDAEYKLWTGSSDKMPVYKGSVTGNTDVAFNATISKTGTVTVKFGEMDINHFAQAAGSKNEATIAPTDPVTGE